jgi:N-acetylmuramoyl-L-alanine amidase
MKIMLDAGHGYNTSGKRSPDGMKEYEFNRVVAEYAKQFFETYQNVTISFAHSDLTDVPLQQRTDKANNLKVDLYISIHANAYGSGWNDAGGIETYVYPQRTQQQYNLAQKIQTQLISQTGLRNRGVKAANFHVLRETYMSAILIEGGFMTNPAEIKLLRSDSYRRNVADAIVKAVAGFYGLQKKPIPAPTPQTGLYKVQVGAFKQRANANALSEQLKRVGFSNFITSENGLYKVQAGAFKDKDNADELLHKLRNVGYQAYVYRE